MAKKKSMSALELIQQLSGSIKQEVNILNEVKENYIPQYHISTGSVILNYQMSGLGELGMPGNCSLQLIGEKSSGKSLIGKIMLKNFHEMFDNSVAEIIDTEGSINADKLTDIGIDINRVVMTDVDHILELKDNIKDKLDVLDRSHNWIFFIDSIGNLSSSQENSMKTGDQFAALGSKARETNLMFRAILRRAYSKHVPLIFINRSYNNMNTNPFTPADEKTTVGGGTSNSYSPSITLELKAKTLYTNVEYVKENGNKSKKKIPIGLEITSNALKNRFAKQNTSVKFTISYEKGLLKYSGLFEYALESGILNKVKEGRSSFWKFNNSETLYKTSDDVTDKEWEFQLKGELGKYLNEYFSQVNLFQKIE